jgi:hypothetical protein
MTDTGSNPWNNLVLTIHNITDIIAIRLEVRKLARRAGLDLASQASIALATSTLAYLLGLENCRFGRVEMRSRVHEDSGFPGVQLALFVPKESAASLTNTSLNEVRWLVDDIELDQSGEDYAAITVVKWAAHAVREA